MAEFKFKLGDIVFLDPVGEKHGPKGKIIGRTEFIDGAIGYIVSSQTSLGQDVILRHNVIEAEIHLANPPVFASRDD